MSQQVDAIYDSGVLRPLGPLALPDQARVTLTVDAHGSSDSLTRTNDAQHENQAVNGGTADAALEEELDSLLFDGPTLPADFSRADIYLDHD